MAAITGPVNTSRRKADLVEIAEALSLTSTGTVKELVSRINAHIKDHSEEIAADARLQGLTSYRVDKTLRAKADSKARGKTSADKAREDHAADAEGTTAATGAHKKLLDSKVPSDPPPKFVVLQQKLPAAADRVPDEPQTSDMNKDEDITSVSSMPNTPRSASPSVEEEVHPQLPKTPIRASKQWQSGATAYENMNLVVNFRDRHNRDTSIEEVFVDGTDISIEKHLVNGEEGYFTRLSSVLPAAINQSTPIKARGGRLYRTGLSHDDGHMSLGSVQAFVDGEIPRKLRFEKVDLYPVTLLSDKETWACNIFVDTEGKAGDTSAKDQPVAQNIAGIPRRPAPTALAGPGPLTSNVSSQDFIDFLRETLDAPPGEWPKAKTIGDILERHLALEVALKYLNDNLKWSKKMGGFQVPDGPDYHQFPGRKFKKEDVHTAFYFSHTSPTQDAHHFKDRKRIPRLLRWYNNPQGAEQAFFAEMSIKDFTKWVRNALAKSAQAAKDDPKGKGKKRAQESDIDEQVAKKNQKTYIEIDTTSDNMDEDWN